MRSTRRDALKALGVTLAVATVGGVETLARAAAEPQVPARHSPTPEAPSPFADLEGARFAQCTVTRVGPVEEGSIPVTFVDSQGESFIVDVLRHDPVSPGVARAGSLAVYMKVGRTRRPTREPHGLAAMALAVELAGREAAGEPVPGLLTLSERAALRAS